MSEMLEILKKDLEEVKRDRAKEGTVIRWKMNDQYTFAAVKAIGRWWLTGKGVSYGGLVCAEYEELVEVLSRADTSEVAVATEWGAVEAGDSDV